MFVYNAFRRASGNALHNRGQIPWSNIKLFGVKTYFTLLRAVLVYQMYEFYEQFLLASYECRLVYFEILLSDKLDKI